MIPIISILLFLLSLFVPVEASQAYLQLINCKNSNVLSRVYILFIRISGPVFKINDYTINTLYLLRTTVTYVMSYIYIQVRMIKEKYNVFLIAKGQVLLDYAIFVSQLSTCVTILTLVTPLRTIHAIISRMSYV